MRPRLLPRLAAPGLALVLLVSLAGLAAPAHARAEPVDWTEQRVMNMPHSGGEDEAPMNTLYAFKRSVKLGGDMIELDVQSTKDGKLVVIHDATVDATTNGTGQVVDMRLKRLKRFDAAHWFVKGQSATHDAPRRAYKLRGAKYGKVRVRGYRPRDFTIPTLRQVFRAFPRTPINIEIKGTSDTDEASFMRTAEILATFLKRRGRTDVIVASFKDTVLARFHQLAPEIPLSASTAALVAYFLTGVRPPEGTVALQAPVRYQGIEVITRDFIDRAHQDGYVVHAWFSGTAPDDRATYNKVIDACVDGIMPSRPRLLERILDRRGIERPGDPDPGRC